eukprot:12380457-Alexandrium_andersonii.AAC.1
MAMHASLSPPSLPHALPPRTRASCSSFSKSRHLRVSASASLRLPLVKSITALNNSLAEVETRPKFHI